MSRQNWNVMQSNSQTAPPPSELSTSAALNRLYKRFGKRVARTAAIRKFVFALFLSIHALRRARIPVLQRSEHRLNAYKFFSMSMGRFRRGLGVKVEIERQIYLCQHTRLLKAVPHGASVTEHPWLSIWLYLANVLKLQGFFDDSEALYRWLSTKAAVRSIALRGLGDLLALQSTWAHEFRSYQADGIAINALAYLPQFAHVKTWHSRSFSEANAVLMDAVQAEPDNPDGWWLLAYLSSEAGNWQQALEADRECSLRSITTFEERFSNAARTFPLDRAAGVRLYETALESWSGWWRVLDAQLASAFELCDRNDTHYLGVGNPTTQLVSARVIRDEKVIPVQSELRFDASYVVEYDYAEILPQYGMVLANHKYLITDSAHVKPCHVPLFTEAVRAISDNRALVVCRAAMQYARSGCVYIGHNKNYYHWLLDEVPRLSLLQLSGQYQDAPILIDVSAAQWQIELLHRLGIEHSRLRAVDFSEPLGVNNLIVPSRLSKEMVAHPDAVGFMRAQLVPNADSLTPRPGKRIFLSRGEKTARSMLNENEVINKFKRAGFLIVDTGRMTLDQQIDLFSDVEIIAGPGGAALTNALFAPRNAKVISLSSTNVTCHTFTSISAALGQESWMLNGASYPRAHPRWIWSACDFEIAGQDIDLCFSQVL
ncbi:glycosyltransferase family 61 protein [Paraburkholderia caribensis]|uniref:glycosyltransferase family 61 protein n=1 Tax=Paraburkholderia caribensis TaxID=75105 RepID=UPI002862AAB0|nr:glycosyltransferase family 61 protein [Paraburkholderia caribensis]MDR6383861.1 tetratricopeptide (TPR) repeat protein [Paraburkholderia caribensis]